MHKLIFLGILFAGQMFAAKGQTYTFEKDTAAYVELSNPTIVSGSILWDEEEFTVPLGFQMLFLGEMVNQVKADGNGWVVFSNNPTNGIKKIFIGFGADMASKGSVTSLSPVSWQLTGNPGERVLIIQYKNAGFFNDSSAAYANFQVWLREINYALEVHMGDVQVFKKPLAYDGKNGPTIGIFQPDSELTHFMYSLGLTGDPANPVADTFDIVNPGSLNETPASGTVYRFVPHAPTGINEPKTAMRVWLYPNPATHVLYAETEGHGELTLLDATAREVKRITLAGKVSSIPLAELNPGLYYVHMQQGEQHVVRKISIVR